MDNHYWISAPRRSDRDRIRAGLTLPPVLAVVDGHRNLRGPYTAAGAVVRLIGPDALGRSRELGRRHYIEIQESTPELASAVPAIVRRLDSAAAPGEVSRYPARLHTLRISHGLTEFLRDYLAALGGGARTLVVENAHEADPTDQEFLAVLLRRLPPRLLTLVVCTAASRVAELPGPAPVSLGRSLADHAVHVDTVHADAPASPASPEAAGADAVAPAGQADAAGLARAYVDSDGTSDDPAQRAAYAGLSAGTRAALHDARLAELTGLGQPSLRLGAIPYHAERGSDPAGTGAQALRWAQTRCKSLGFYHSAAEFGVRGRAAVDRLGEPKLWWGFTKDMAVCLSAAGRAEEAEAVHDETRRLTADPFIHMQLAYETAMLYARHYGEGKRDQRLARAWLNEAIAIASLLEDPGERSFYSVFNRNGLALVEMREGKADEALRLLDEGIERLDRELGLGERTMHRTGLRYNRAQVCGMSGRLAEALADYTAVIEIDDTFPDHFFNRGSILRRLGRTEEAIADYERALRLAPPFPEAYYNRGDARMELGDAAGALADFARAIELDPDNVGARVNRASILADLGENDAAAAEVAAGLAIEAGNAHLLCLNGRLLAERGEAAAAREALSAALRVDPGLAEAWAVMGGLEYEAGDLPQAITDLDRAIDLRAAPEIRFNRAVAYQAMGRFAEAAADFGAVAAATGDADARLARDTCLRAAEHAHA